MTKFKKKCDKLTSESDVNITKVSGTLYDL